MEEKEILGILFKHLLDNPREEALILAQRDVAHLLLDRLTVDYPLEDKYMHMLKTVAEAKSRFSFFAEFLGKVTDTAVLLPKENLAQLLDIHHKFIDMLSFLVENYDELDWSCCKGQFEKNTLGNLLNVFKQKHEQYRNQFEEKETILADLADFHVIRQTWDLIFFVVLREDVAARFAEQFNFALRVFRMAYAQMRIRRSNKTIN